MLQKPEATTFTFPDSVTIKGIAKATSNKRYVRNEDDDEAEEELAMKKAKEAGAAE